VAGHSVGEPSLGNRVGGLRLCPDEGDTIPHPARGRYEWPGLEQNRNGGFELSEAHPLDWTLYVTRGYANVSLQKWLQAVADFRYALLLERKLPMVPFDEGRAWVGVNRELALAAWNECLRRSSGTERNEFYRLILATSYCDPRLREEALRLSDTDAQLAMTALRSGYADSTSWNFSRRGNRLWVRTNSKPCCGRKPRKRRSIKNSRKRAKLGGKG
jgi:tetratricopeptide (TPR) repeat protein